MFHILLPDGDTRSALIEALAKRDIQAVFHYIPLHDSPAGSRFGHSPSDLPITADLSRRLLRLPLWAAMEEHHTDRVTEAVSEALRGTVSTAEFQPQES